MSRLEARELARLRELERWLGSIGDGPSTALSPVVDVVQELFRSKVACAYGVQVNDQAALSVDFLIGAGFPSKAPQQDLESCLQRSGPRFALYDALRPEPMQRDRVVTLTDLSTMTRQNPTQAPLATTLWRQWQLDDCDQLRVLLCDGPVLLAWFGALRPDPFSKREHTILRRLAPTVKRRLTLERRLGPAHSEPLIVAALEAIGAPAFVLGPSWRVEYANAAGRTFLETKGAAALVPPEVHTRFDITELAFNGGVARRLAVQRASIEDPSARVAVATQRWSLTRRQAEVLALVAEGHANKTIAAILGCVENTVEVHVSALLEKSDCESRSELVGKFWTMPPR